MFDNIKFRKNRTSPPMWILIAAFCIMILIVGIMIFQNIKIQKKDSIKLLTEKGVALIRFFEASTRAGMLEMKWGRNDVQRLLTAAARQPDIDYILVSDPNGLIIAHSNQEFIGKMHDVKGIPDIDTVNSRTIIGPSGKKVFEVSTRFKPIRRRGMGPPGGCIFLESFRPPRPNRPPRLKINDIVPDLTIFIGIDIAPVEKAIKAGTIGIIGTGAMLIFAAFSAVIFLHLVQSYRTARASLSKIKAFSDTLVQNIPIGLIALDNDYKIASINPVAESMLKIDFLKVAGKKADSVLPHDIAGQLKFIQDQKIEKEMECELDQGRKLPLEITFSPLKEDGIKTGNVIILKDLREIRGLRQKIAINERFAYIGRVAGGVAHEIRNPLSSIKGFASYFKDRYKDSPKDNEIAKIMIQETDRLNRVVSQLLEFTRPLAVTLKKLSLNEVIQNALNSISHPIKKSSIKVKLDFRPMDIKVYADPDRIKQVFINLFLNAAEAMSPDRTISVFASKEEGLTKISVSDTGEGIKKEDIPHIFEPYFTSRQYGTGLGLAIVHNIIDAHHGKIEVNTKLGTGTQITIFLPYDEKR